MQLYTHDTPVAKTVFTAWWLDPKPSTFNLDWQELTYDWTTGGVSGFYFGDLQGYWSRANGSYGIAGGTEKEVLVPEPRTLILLGSGLLVLVLAGSRKKFRK